MRRILSIQDLSCAGRCSLTVALPVLSAMGLQCAVLPTAVLSTHTGFPDPYVRPMTDSLIPIADHWKTQNMDFDGITVGYLSDPAQAQAVSAVLDRLTGCVILDPAMGDGGRLYARITDEHIQGMKQLCKKAHVLLPNVTEAAYLTDTAYEDAVCKPEALVEKLMDFGPKAVVITGVTKDDQIGVVGSDGTLFRYMARRDPKELHGTGDLFTAVFAGATLLGKSCREAAQMAADFVQQVIANTQAVTSFGPDFERQLPWLWKKLNTENQDA